MFKKWMKTNKPLLSVAKKYWAVSTKYEKITDIGFPILITLVTCTLVLLKQPALPGFLTFLNQIVNTIITVLSILAGFNVAAVSIIASSQSPIIQKLAEPTKEGANHTPLEGLIAFFSWSIAVQLIILLGSIAFTIVAGTVLTPGKAVFAHIAAFPKLPILLSLMFIGITATLHSLFLSIRNIAGLYLLIVMGSKKKDESQNHTQ